MPVKKPIECIISFGGETLAKAYQTKIDNGLSTYEAAREVVLDEHKKIHKKINEIRVAAKQKEIPYAEPAFDKEKVEKIKAEYQSKTDAVNEAEAAKQKTITNENTQQDNKSDEPKPTEEGEPATGATTEAGQGAKEPPGEPPVDDGAEDGGKQKGNFNFFKNRVLKNSGELETYLSKPTIEVSGEEITQPFDYDVKKLDDMVASGKDWMQKARAQFNKNATEYAERLLKDLKNLTTKLPEKVVAMASLMNSIDADLKDKNLSIGERDLMKSIRRELELLIAKNAREGSLTLNAMRLIHKLYKGEYKYTKAMESLVGKDVQEAADDVVEKMKEESTDISEVVKENKRKQKDKETPPPPKNEKKPPKEKKTAFFDKAMGALSKEDIDKLKKEITDLSNKIKCGGL